MKQLHYKHSFLLIILIFLCSAKLFSTTYIVTALTDNGGVNPAVGAGTGTLRQAIIDANANAGADIINFNIAGAGPHTISLTAELPALSDNAGVTIDGFSQSGSSVNTVPVFSATASTPMNAIYKICISGSSGTTNWFKGLIVSSNNNTIKGIVFKSFGGTSVTSYFNNPAIYITGNYNSVLGCYIGMAEDGITKGGSKTGIGVYIDGAVNGQGHHNNVGDGTAAGANLISGLNDGQNGVRIWGASAANNVVKGNMIGLQKDGSTMVAGADQQFGVNISMDAYSNTIGGTIAGEGNVISGNGYGIGLGSASAFPIGNSVLGNIIGPRADGISYVTSNSQLRGVYITSPNNIIGGSSMSERNIISANEQHGIYIQGTTSSTNSIKGNYIGIDKTGTAIISGSSQDFGIAFSTGVSAPGPNTIGGSTANEGNVISGNTSIGIYLTASSMSVYGNIIGLQYDGVSYLNSNSQVYGIQIGGTNNVIGGNTSLMRNIISGNEFVGVYITGSGATGNIIKGNYLGPDAALANISGANQDYGIYIVASSANNIIGDTLAGEANVIAYNTVNGSLVNGVSTNGNKISASPHYSNGGKPINLNSTGNNNKSKPVITYATVNTVGGTSSPGDVVEVFNDVNGNCFDAHIYVGAAVANGAGNWSLTTSLVTATYVLATARDASNNTSEFSLCSYICPVITSTQNPIICSNTSYTLPDGVLKLLSAAGKFYVILPKKESERFIEMAAINKLFLTKQTKVITRSDKPEKRLLMRFEFTNRTFSEDSITIEKDERHSYTDEYKELTKEYYLAF